MFLNQKDGKFIPEKVGLKAVQKDGLDYEFTIVFDVDIKHFAVSSKEQNRSVYGKTRVYNKFCNRTQNT